MSERGLHWGAIGASWIAQDWVIPASAKAVPRSSPSTARIRLAATYGDRNGIPRHSI